MRLCVHLCCLWHTQGLSLISFTNLQITSPTPAPACSFILQHVGLAHLVTSCFLFVILQWTSCTCSLEMLSVSPRRIWKIELVGCILFVLLSVLGMDPRTPCLLGKRCCWTTAPSHTWRFEKVFSNFLVSGPQNIWTCKEYWHITREFTVHRTHYLDNLVISEAEISSAQSPPALEMGYSVLRT